MSYNWYWIFENILFLFYYKHKFKNCMQYFAISFIFDTRHNYPTLHLWQHIYFFEKCFIVAKLKKKHVYKRIINNFNIIFYCQLKNSSVKKSTIFVVEVYLFRRVSNEWDYFGIWSCGENAILGYDHQTNIFVLIL